MSLRKPGCRFAIIKCSPTQKMRIQRRRANAGHTGTSDFWSFDPYTTGFATSPPNGIDACASNSSDPNWPMCVINTNVQQDGWLNGQASYAYAYIAPQYVRQQFGYVWDTFRPSGILVAEFGFNPFMEYAKVRRTHAEAFCHLVGMTLVHSAPCSDLAAIVASLSSSS